VRPNIHIRFGDTARSNITIADGGSQRFERDRRNDARGPVTHQIRYGAGMILQTLDAVEPDIFAERTGWSAKQMGMCRGEVCVPAPGSLRGDGTLDVAIVAACLGMPIVHDEAHQVWAIGPATTSGRALTTAAAADPVLTTRDGQPFRLSSLHGRKVLLVAWSSY
jgi:hypothetical protein